MAKVKFVLYRKGFQAEVLKGEGVKDMLRERAERAAPPGDDIEVYVNESESIKGRARAAIVDHSYGAASREAREGHLSRAIGEMQVRP